MLLRPFISLMIRRMIWPRPNRCLLHSQMPTHRNLRRLPQSTPRPSPRFRSYSQPRPTTSLRQKIIRLRCQLRRERQQEKQHVSRRRQRTCCRQRRQLQQLTIRDWRQKRTQPRLRQQLKVVFPMFERQSPQRKPLKNRLLLRQSRHRLLPQLYLKPKSFMRSLSARPRRRRQL